MKASVTSKADKARTQCDEDSILRVWNVSTPGPGTTLASDDENSSPKVDEPFSSKAVYGGYEVKRCYVLLFSNKVSQANPTDPSIHIGSNNKRRLQTKPVAND